ncbi:MAG TPA: DUF2141 domain-containing protein [Rhizomicrobium sp.]|nr:DUF2141 domain-containing protein [Rhizomicrobium sp.]
MKLIIAKFGADASTPLDKIPLALRREMAEDALRTIGVEVGRDHGGRTAEGVEAVVRQLLVTLLLISLSVLPAIAAELRVTVNGIRSDKGEILIALYKDPAGFARAIANGSRGGLTPDSGRLVGCSIRAQVGSQSTVFTQLKPGRYAIAVIHDENDNGHLDRNFLDIPVEGYGFGNNARRFFSAPSFNAASIVIGNSDVSTSVTLVYP